MEDLKVVALPLLPFVSRGLPSNKPSSCWDIIDSLLRKDARYRKYCAGMDRILSSFDAVNEWADVIGFLAKLIKVETNNSDLCTY